MSEAEKKQFESVIASYKTETDHGAVVIASLKSIIVNSFIRNEKDGVAYYNVLCSLSGKYSQESLSKKLGYKLTVDPQYQTVSMHLTLSVNTGTKQDKYLTDKLKKKSQILTPFVKLTFNPDYGIEGYILGESAILTPEQVAARKAARNGAAPAKPAAKPAEEKKPSPVDLAQQNLMPSGDDDSDDLSDIGIA